MALPSRQPEPPMRPVPILLMGGLLNIAAALAAPGDALPLPDAIRAEPGLPPIYDYRATDLETLRRGFANPPREVGPWVYWFWWNNVVSREEIARELEEMAAAGLAGAELRVVTFHGWGGPPLEGMDDANLERLGQRRVGYDLRERFHALLGYGPEAERVRHDLETVEQQLIHENFFATVTGFLHERGLRHRPQAYGRGLARDLLHAYVLADTPEIEPTLVLPEAVWAARTTGKPVVSAEAFTFLGLYQSLGRSPVRMSNGLWEATPAALRLAANHFYGEGINRIQMHGFGYSPPGLPLPGWRMYAEVHFNRNVPWWPFIKPLIIWMARQQWLLQAGSPVADTLVYPVIPNPPDGPFFQMGDRQPISAGNAIDAAVPPRNHCGAEARPQLGRNRGPEPSEEPPRKRRGLSASFRLTGARRSRAPVQRHHRFPRERLALNLDMESGAERTDDDRFGLHVHILRVVAHEIAVAVIDGADLDPAASAARSRRACMSTTTSAASVTPNDERPLPEAMRARPRAGKPWPGRPGGTRKTARQWVLGADRPTSCERLRREPASVGRAG